MTDWLGLNDDGTYRESLWYETIGEAYIPIAFAAAAAANPDVKLYYNDYNIEYSGPKATTAQNIVKLVQSYGVKTKSKSTASVCNPTSSLVAPQARVLRSPTWQRLLPWVSTLLSPSWIFA
jgi:Beta-1,4-xylanase